MILQYFGWHYTRALRDGLHLWMTFVWYPWHLCAIRFHAKHLFSRFNRLGEAYPGTGFHLGELLGSFAVNVIMRVVGAVFRVMVIMLGLLITTGAIVIGALAYSAWVLLPVLTVFVFSLGIVIMFL